MIGSFQDLNLIKAWWNHDHDVIDIADREVDHLLSTAMNKINDDLWVTWSYVMKCTDSNEWSNRFWVKHCTLSEQIYSFRGNILAVYQRLFIALFHFDWNSRGVLTNLQFKNKQKSQHRFGYDFNGYKNDVANFLDP